MSQQEQVQQLQDTNTFLQSQVANMHNDITNVALATASAVAQAITTNPPASIPIQPMHHSNWGAKAADTAGFSMFKLSLNIDSNGNMVIIFNV